MAGRLPSWPSRSAPVPSDRVGRAHRPGIGTGGYAGRVAALRAALPGYDVILTSHSPAHRFEATRRDPGPGTWCLISTNPADLWPMIDEKPRQIEHTRHPGNNGDHVQRLDPVHTSSTSLFLAAAALMASFPRSLLPLCAGISPQATLPLN